jgi:hypothetical protein
MNYFKSNLLRFQNCGDQDMFRSFLELIILFLTFENRKRGSVLGVLTTNFSSTPEDVPESDF